MNQIIDEHKLVELVEDLKSRIYHEHEIRSKRELDLILKELERAVNRDYKASLRNNTKPETDIDPEEYIG